MTPAPPGAEPPLARLFALGFRSLIDGLHEELAARGWNGVRPAFGFVLLAARDEPTSSSAIAALMGMSKQAASKLIDSMVDAGYVERATGATDRRQRPVVLTARGRRLLDEVEDIYRELEARWAAVIGDGELEHLRSLLTRVLTSDGTEQLPPIRPTW